MPARGVVIARVDYIAKAEATISSYDKVPTGETAVERYMLLGGLRLYDRQKETLLDLTPLLLTPEVKAEAEEFLQSEQDFPISDSEFEWYWSYINIGLPMADPVPELHFNYAKGKKLYKEYPLVYKLPR